MDKYRDWEVEREGEIYNFRGPVDFREAWGHLKVLRPDIALSLDSVPVKMYEVTRKGDLARMCLK